MARPPTSTAEDAPVDAVAGAVAEVLVGATVDVVRVPAGSPRAPSPAEPGVATATGVGPGDPDTTFVVRLDEAVARLLPCGPGTPLAELLDGLASAGVRTAAQVRHYGDAQPQITPAFRRALRDTVAAEALTSYLVARVGSHPRHHLVAETIEFLIELGGTRVEAHDLTHGVVVTDVLRHTPRLELRYPGDVRAAKRAPLLFDGKRSVLVVDLEGRARTELQRHRFERLTAGLERPGIGGDGWVESGSLVAEATSTLGGIGFFVRADRSIWTFVDGRPLLVRRGEHWTAFPLELTALIAELIGGGAVSALVARAAFVISAQPQGAILAIVDDPSDLDVVVSTKDRYDLRDDVDPTAMRPETRLHHLIDAEDLDEQTLVRLAALDGATVLDRDGRLLAYGAIVASADSQHEGARTAAARTLSETAEVVVKVSVDGDITIFRAGAPIATLLGRPAERPPSS